MKITNSRPANLAKKVALAFCLCSSLTVAGTVASPPAHAQNATQVFFNNGYNYCDAKLIAAFWGMGVGRAKAEAGRKILAGGGNVLRNDVMPRARQMARCEWADTGHSYQDAERLAAYWGYGSVWEAKNKVAQLYTQGNTGQVRRSLQAAGRGGGNSGGNNGGGQIGSAISASQREFSCNEGIPLIINLIEQGNQRWAEATHDGVPSGRLRVRDNGRRLTNGQVKLRISGRTVDVNWGGIRDRCRRVR